jgi:hypothetical protein
MKHARWMIAAALALAVVVAVVVPTAGAASNTSVTIKSYTLDAYLAGKVKSSKARCEPGRKVKLYWDRPGSPKRFEKVATDTSDETGTWVIDAPPPTVPPGRYFVKVTEDGTCDKAKSETIKVQDIGPE